MGLLAGLHSDLLSTGQPFSPCPPLPPPEGSRGGSPQPFYTLDVSTVPQLGVTEGRGREREDGDDRGNLLSGFMKVKGATLVPAFFLFLFSGCAVWHAGSILTSMVLWSVEGKSQIIEEKN